MKYQLDNGLTVLLKEAHNAPLVSYWVLYRVGSRNERPGQTGISHWVEHMMFKGTDKFPGGELDRLIDRQGGLWNAETSLDYTAYFETMPSDRFDLALELEADRMVNADFDPDEVESERTVIISERQGSENSPLFWLDEAVTQAAFQTHSYHHRIIGDMADLETMTRDDLYAHYKRHYVPNNAIIVAVGDFDSAAMLDRIRHYYEHIPAGPEPDRFTQPEPPQEGERRVRVERPGNTAFLQVAYRAPAATEDDWFSLTLLDSILSGPSLYGGGGVDNKTSRLYKALVETEIAASIDGGLTPTIDPYLCEMTVTLRAGREVAEAEAVIDRVIERIQVENITQKELARAKKQARALFAYSTEGVTERAFWMAFTENFASYEWFDHYVDRVSAVTLDDLHDVAARYLQPQNRVVGWFVPTDLDGEAV